MADAAGEATKSSARSAQLAQSETVASEAEMRAPADAIVLHRLVEPGQLLAGGQTGLTLAFANRLYVRTFIPEPRLGRVKQGQAAQVSVDAFPGPDVPARRSPRSRATPSSRPKAVETRAERVNLVYAAKVDLDEGWKAPLVPGQPAEVIAPRQAVSGVQPATARQKVMSDDHDSRQRRRASFRNVDACAS